MLYICLAHVASAGFIYQTARKRKKLEEKRQAFQSLLLTISLLVPLPLLISLAPPKKSLEIALRIFPRQPDRPTSGESPVPLPALDWPWSVPADAFPLVPPHWLHCCRRSVPIGGRLRSRRPFLSFFPFSFFFSLFFFFFLSVFSPFFTMPSRIQPHLSTSWTTSDDLGDVAPSSTSSRRGSSLPASSHPTSCESSLLDTSSSSSSSSTSSTAPSLVDWPLSRDFVWRLNGGRRSSLRPEMAAAEHPVADERPGTDSAGTDHRPPSTASKADRPLRGSSVAGGCRGCWERQQAENSYADVQSECPFSSATFSCPRPLSSDPFLSMPPAL